MRTRLTKIGSRYSLAFEQEQLDALGVDTDAADIDVDVEITGQSVVISPATTEDSIDLDRILRKLDRKFAPVFKRLAE